MKHIQREIDVNFMDRTALGTRLAHRLKQLHGRDAVVVCLQESSLLTCLTIASQLRAWVYPLIYAPVYTPDGAHQLLGAFDQDGEFCPLPDNSSSPTSSPEEASSNIDTIVQSARTTALESIRAQEASYGMAFDKRRLDGRDVILVGDVLTNTLPLVMAQQLLKDLRPRSLTALAGNAIPEVAQLLHISAGQTEILDILHGVVSDGDHYFEHADEYTSEQKHTLTQHITAYWQ